MSLTIETSEGPVAFDSTEPVPGLHVYEIPAEATPKSLGRWILAHHEGHVLGSFESSDAAAAAAESVAPLADWTRSVTTVAQVISFGGNTRLLTELLAKHGAKGTTA
jgi:hypothetical protein